GYPVPDASTFERRRGAYSPSAPSVAERLFGMGEVVVVPRRVLRQLIRRHRRRTGGVPHEHCYALSTLELQPLAQELGLDWRPRVPTGYAIVLGESSRRETNRLGP